jgi:hypothetical protein
MLIPSESTNPIVCDWMLIPSESTNPIFCDWMLIPSDALILSRVHGC